MKILILFYFSGKKNIGFYKLFFRFFLFLLHSIPRIPTLIPRIPTPISLFPPLFPYSHLDSPHSHPDSPHSHPHSLHSHPCFPHSQLGLPHSHADSPRSHYAHQSVPQFPILAFTDSQKKLTLGSLKQDR